MARKRIDKGSKHSNLSILKCWPMLLPYLKWFCLLLFVGGLYGIGAFFFNLYFRTNPLYMTDPNHVEIRGCQTIQDEALKGWIGLDKPVNVFAFSESDAIERLKSDAPILSNVKMSITLPNRLLIEVEEREPAVRLMKPRMMADRHGKVFNYPRLMSGLPQILHFEGDTLIASGDQLPDSLRCAIHLIGEVQRKGYAFQLQSVQPINAARPIDGLLLTFSRYRSAKIAWPNMETELTPSDSMCQQLHDLSVAMTSENSLGSTFFNATVLGVVTASK